MNRYPSRDMVGKDPLLVRNLSSPQQELPWYFHEEITNSYESWYEGKYRNADLQEKALLRKSVEWIRNVKTMLEVGCGTAHFTRWFEETGLEPYGADLSPFMLRQAKRLWVDHKLIRSESLSLPLKDKIVDLVAFITCLEYMPDPIRVIHEASRVARIGIILGLMNSWSAPTVRRKIQLLLGRNPYYKNAHFFSLPEVKHLIEEALPQGGYQVFQRSTVFPRFIPVGESSIPLGAFLCVAVRFRQD